MAAQNTLNLIRHWYPKGIDFTHEHDTCPDPTGRFDIWVEVPPMNKRTMDQQFVLLKSNLGYLADTVKNWRTFNYTYKNNPQYFDAANLAPAWSAITTRKIPQPSDKYLLHSMSQLGQDQYLYQRPDAWSCFWKGIELAATGHNTDKVLKLSDFNESFADSAPSTFPPYDPMHRSQFCNDTNTGERLEFGRWGIWGTSFQGEVWMFQRLWPMFSNVAISWDACRQYFQTHSFAGAQGIPYNANTPATDLFEEYQDYMNRISPRGAGVSKNWIKAVKIADPTSEGGQRTEQDFVNDILGPQMLEKLPVLTPPYTDSVAELHESGIVISPPA